MEGMRRCGLEGKLQLFHYRVYCSMRILYSSPTLPTLHSLSMYRIAHALLVGDFDGDACEFRRAVALQAAQTEGGGGRGGGSEDSQAQEGRCDLTEHDSRRTLVLGWCRNLSLDVGGVGGEGK